MQLRRLAVLALAVAVAACGSDDDGGSDTVDLSRARVVIISGDGQRAQVPDPAPQGAIVPQAVVGEAMLPDPLVVRVTHDAPQAGITGISAAVVPEGTPVHWRIPQDGCGEPFGGTTVTNATGESTNRVILGTVAGECSVQVGRVLASGDVVIDSTFVYELLPGTPTFLGSGVIYTATEGEPLDLSQPINGFAALDAHGNSVPDSMVVANWTPTWAIYGPLPSRHAACDTAGLHSEGAGWSVPFAPPHHEYGYCIEIFIEGHTTGLWRLTPQAASPQ